LFSLTPPQEPFKTSHSLFVLLSPLSSLKPPAMAEIETTLPPEEKLPVVDHKTESIHGPNDEKVSSSYEHHHEHRDNHPVPGTEELGDVYDPNVYAGASYRIPTPH
jgi:hypothetical protein